MKGILLYCVILFAVGGANAAFGQAKDKDLANFAEVRANLFRGGQPTEAGIAKLKMLGVKTIIDLRGEDEHAAREKIWAQNNGINFVAVSLSNWFKPKTADIEAVIKQIDAAENQPVFVHCKRGADRTGTVIAVYRITHDNYTAAQALAEAKKYDFGWWQFWMKDYIEDYARDYAKGTAK